MKRPSETSIQWLRVGDIIAEVTIELHPREGKDYNATVSVADALKVERVKRALESGDLARAAAESRIYRLTPVSAA